MTIEFDAIGYAQQLEAAGAPRTRAEVHARTLAHVVGNCVPLPSDLHDLRNELLYKLAETEARLRSEIAQSEARLRSEIAQSEARLREEIRALASRVDKLEVSLRAQMTYLKWMNGLTLALLVGLIVKTSLA
ncbi:MAG: hypothetical protein ACJ8LG_10085 [Massilia sp.]